MLDGSVKTINLQASPLMVVLRMAKVANAVVAPVAHQHTYFSLGITSSKQPCQMSTQ